MKYIAHKFESQSWYRGQSQSSKSAKPFSIENNYMKHNILYFTELRGIAVNSAHTTSVYCNQTIDIPTVEPVHFYNIIVLSPSFLCNVNGI